MKIFRLTKDLVVTFPDGTVLSTNECTDKLFEQVKATEDEDVVKHLLIPEYYNKVEEYNTKKELIDGYSDSKILTTVGGSIYINSVSELTVPQDLALAISKAEKKGDTDLVQSYINFWTLVSLNPDSRVRTNLFWFLQKYGMQISSSGLFVAYRNVLLKEEGSKISQKLAKAISKAYTKIKFKKGNKASKYVMIGNPDKGFRAVKESNVEGYFDVIGNLQDLYEELGKDAAPVYTDAHSRTFTIKVGTPVTMDRSKCNPNQDQTCSTGLHVAGKQWLEGQGDYFGNVALKVLVNPADCVCVPPFDLYGKMRVCAYYPVEILDRVDGVLINDNTVDGFEDDFINIITYTGDINNEDHGNYSLDIPVKPELNRSNILSRLNEIKYGDVPKLVNHYMNEDDDMYGEYENEDEEWDDDDYCYGDCW